MDMWKVIAVDNFARETVADILISDGLSEREAEDEADRLNVDVTENDLRWHQAVKQSYILSKGMLDFI